MPSAVFKTNPNVAKLAVTTGKLLPADPENISQRHVPPVVVRREFPLSQRPTDRFIAVTVSQERESKQRHTEV